MNPQLTLKKWDNFTKRDDLNECMELLINALSAIYENDQKSTHEDPLIILKEKLGLIPEGISHKHTKKKLQSVESHASMDDLADADQLSTENVDLQNDIRRLQEQEQQLTEQIAKLRGQ